MPLSFDPITPRRAEIPRPSPRAAGGKALVVLLPGFGYGHDKPLLHYARRAAQRGGLAVEAVDYGPLPREEDLACRVRRAFPAAFAAAAAQLDAAAEREEWRDVYLVGKSFGTLIAGELASQRPALPIRQICLTPVPAALPYLERPDCLWAACGDADPLLTGAALARMRALLGSRLQVFAGANHSLEVPGDPMASIEILRQVTAALCGLLR